MLGHNNRALSYAQGVTMTTQTAQSLTRSQAGKAFGVAVNIMRKWGATNAQMLNIVQLPKSTFFKYLSDPESANLSKDQLTRISYVLNIHAGLRTVFDNKANVYGFMTYPNHGPYFNGAAPLDVIAGGDFSALYETFRRVDALRGPW